ncbi:VQ motif-containing protein 20 [Senna tora]|uniref:VQ motif-containing protein 20 n=1 Tax=Senna tora TaxID=362788 RepID=A0A834TD04_9FABA|nr:VQ motif-containing protein 20 [Senna tora]
MSPTRFHPKREILTHNHHTALCPPPLKIHRDSHSIKKSSSTSSASSTLVNKPIQRHPVIIYTHSPKVIHTHPRDFMALVQKLTGLHRSDNNNNNDAGAADPPPPPPQQQPAKQEGGGAENYKKACANEENETSSVITEENNCSSSAGETQVNSCFMTNPPILDAALNPYMTNLPVFPPNSADLLCSNQPFLNYDSLFLSHNIRNSMNPSTANLEGMNDFREY